jgi:hypothetical protein
MGANDGGILTDQLPSIDEIQRMLPKGAELLVDDLVLFEPGF